ncbi:MAG: lysophospholipid acyltransferase family protein [Gemmatimonadales bacterium]|nr:lysophospholipid acyltransferase family protein [Gemmatimonadales bacterium]
MAGGGTLGALRLSAPAAAPPYAPPRPWLVAAFARYFASLFRSHFSSTRWHHLDDPATWDRSLPTLFIANHTNWWDGFFSLLLTRAMGMGCHVLMEARNLDRYPPFRWIGVIPVRRHSVRGAYEDLVAAQRCLQPDTGLWIYPSGGRRPMLEPVQDLERGAAHLALSAGQPVRICPVALRYVFLGEQRPEAFALVGEPWVLLPGGRDDRRSLTLRLQQRLQGTVDALDALLRTEQLDAFRPLVPGSLSINKRVDLIRHRLGLLEGPFDARNG